MRVIEEAQAILEGCQPTSIMIDPSLDTTVATEDSETRLLSQEKVMSSLNFWVGSYVKANRDNNVTDRFIAFTEIKYYKRLAKNLHGLDFCIDCLAVRVAHHEGKHKGF